MFSLRTMLKDPNKLIKNYIFSNNKSKKKFLVSGKSELVVIKNNKLGKV